MSGIALIWNRDGAPVDHAAMDDLASGLDHRAIDGRDVWYGPTGNLALAHHHFWATPEEVGERQPLVNEDLAVAFDGRLDNRIELAEALDIALADAAALSDAALILRSFARWGLECLARLAGPFALVIWDGRRRRLVCARDRLGRRALYYRLAQGLVVVASEPGAIMASMGGSAALDEVFLAHYFALWSPPSGRTVYSSVCSLDPAYCLVVDAVGHRLERYGTLRLDSLRYRCDDEYGEHLHELLDRAVRRRMRAVGTPAVMMSGGLDSPAVAALAAMQLRAAQPAARLAVVSYVFDELVELDERRWMAPMVGRYDLDQLLVRADDAWPLSDFGQWQWNPSGPDHTPFRPLNARLFAAAREAGVRVLLTGAVSDGLHQGAASWLADLVAHKRYHEAADEVMKYVRRLGWRHVLRSHSVRRLAAALVGRKGQPESPPSWLTPQAAEWLEPPPMAALAGRSPRRHGDVRAVLGAVSEDDGIDAGRFFHSVGVQVWDPFSDVEVVTFALTVPAYALYNRGKPKWVLRAAMRDVLPRALLDRLRRSDISLLFDRGVNGGGATIMECLIGDRAAPWRRFVRAEWVTPPGAAVGRERTAGLVEWQCAVFSWWQLSAHGSEPAPKAMQTVP